MAITVQCPHCGKNHHVPEGFAGKHVKCRCGKKFDVPAQKSFGDFVNEELAAAPPPAFAPKPPAQAWWIPFGDLSPAARRKLNLFISVASVLLPLVLIGAVFYVMVNRTPPPRPFVRPDPPPVQPPVTAGNNPVGPKPVSPDGKHPGKGTEVKPIPVPPPPSQLAETLSTLKKQGAKFKSDKSGAIIEVDYSSAVDEHNAVEFDDSMLAVLEKIPTLKRLNLADTPLSDAGLDRVKGLSGLTHLTLSNTHVSDSGLRRLADLTNLTKVVIERGQISGTGVETWSKLTNLTDLTLSGSQITDAGLSAIGKLSSLTTLQLDGCMQISNSGLARLKGLTRLSFLDLSRTRVSDAGAAHLANLTELKSLFLSGCSGIGDDALKEFSALTNLTQLELQNTLTSNKAIDKLRSSLPGCKIVR